MSEKEKQEFLARVPIEEKIGIQQKGRMKVGAQIIEQLSKGVYSTPEMAIKELISNSFDADAAEVVIETKSGFGSISIRDNGHGMDYKDFDNDYVFISKSPHVGKDEKTKILNRPVIGRLGIGFLAVSQLCDTLIITSAKRNENTKFVAVLDFGKFKNKDNRGAEFSDISEYVLTNYEKKNRDESFTHIELKDLTKPFKNVLKNIPEPGVKLKKTDDLDFVDIVRKVWNAKDYLEIEKTYGPYWKFVINLASIVPVEYMKNGPIKDKRYSEVVKPFKDYTSDLNFKVFFDGMQIRKLSSGEAQSFESPSTPPGKLVLQPGQAAHYVRGGGFEPMTRAEWRARRRQQIAERRLGGRGFVDGYRPPALGPGRS